MLSTTLSCGKLPVTDWATVGISVATSGGVAAGIVALINMGLQRRLTARVEAAKIALAEKLKDVDVLLAEADRKSALALRRDDSRMTMLLQVNRMASDAEALAHNATLDTYGDGIPISPGRPFANIGGSHEETRREAARLISDAYFFDPELGQAVMRLRDCEDELQYEATEYRSPLEPFPADHRLIVELKAAALEVREQVQNLLRAWEYRSR
jgi:hypothetical protein